MQSRILHYAPTNLRFILVSRRLYLVGIPILSNYQNLIKPSTLIQKVNYQIDNRISIKT